MNSYFLQGFADEIIKTGGVAKKIRAGATTLGRRVQQMTKKVVKRAKGMRAQTKGGAGLKGVVKKADEAATDSAGAGEILRAIIEEAQARLESEGYGEGEAELEGDANY